MDVFVNARDKVVTSFSTGYDYVARFGLNDPETVLKNVSKVAIPIIATAMMSNLPIAVAGDKEFIECSDACLQAGNSVVKCFFACIAFLFIG